MGRYAVPICQGGSGGLPIFAGERRQVGGNLFSTIKRIAMPIIRAILPHLKKFGKRAAVSALNVGTGVAGDVIAGNFKDIPSNFRKRGREEINSMSRDYLGTDIMRGSGKRRRVMKSINKKKKKKALPIITTDAL
jgi:hypothetical protein